MQELTRLYYTLIEKWNERDASGIASLYTSNGMQIGFDGSTFETPDNIEAELKRIFSTHTTAPFVAKIKSVRLLTVEVGVLQAIAGMTPNDTATIDPKLNAIQTLVGQKVHGIWRVSLFQNTPAALHGRPELVDAMTRELNEAAQTVRH